MNRTCRYCYETFALTKDHFGHNPQGGFRWKCRKCIRKDVRRYNTENSFRARERTEWRIGTTLTSREKRKYTQQIALRDGGYVCFYCKRDLGTRSTSIIKYPLQKAGHIVSKTSPSPACPATKRSMRRTSMNTGFGGSSGDCLFSSNKKKRRPG